MSITNLLTKTMPLTAALHAAAEAEAQCPAPPEPRAVDLPSLQARIDAFQLSRFPSQSLNSKLTHLVREVRELRADPEDITEWADVLILLLGAAATAGLDTYDLVNAARIKMTINESRRWPAEPDAEGIYHHLD